MGELNIIRNRNKTRRRNNMDITTKVINDTESLIKSISKCAATISDKKVKERAEKWVANYSSDLFNILSSYPKTIKILKYLTKSTNNQRLIRKKWLKSLKIIKKSSTALKLSGGKQILFFDPNKPFTAYQILKGLFAKTKREVLILDGYVEEGTLDILSSIPKSVKIKILTNNTYGKFLREIPKFKKEFPKCEVKKSSLVHDRFFIIDSKCFISGTSLHSLGGKKASYIFEVSKGISTIFKNYFNTIWDQGSII